MFQHICMCVLIRDSHVQISCFVKCILHLNVLSSASALDRKLYASVTAYSMYLNRLIHTDCTNCFLYLTDHTLYFSFCLVGSYINLTYHFYIVIFQEMYNRNIQFPHEIKIHMHKLKGFPKQLEIDLYKIQMGSSTSCHIYVCIIICMRVYICFLFDFVYLN